MRTENQFNAWLSKELRKMQPKCFHLKASDRFTEGVSDFLIWYASNTFAMEVKFISSWPPLTQQLLGHPFTGAQLTFLESMSLAGNTACGLVSVFDDQRMYLIPWDKIPPNGNWKAADFVENHGGNIISWDDPKMLLAALMMKRVAANYER